jgi:hypothetical protein
VIRWLKRVQKRFRMMFGVTPGVDSKNRPSSIDPYLGDTLCPGDNFYDEGRPRK